MKIALIAAAVVLACGAAASAQTATHNGLPAQTQDKGGGTGPTSGGVGGMGGGKFGEPGGNATEARGVGSSLIRQASPPTSRPAFGPGSEAAAPMAHPMMAHHRTMHHKRMMRRHRRHMMHHTMMKK